MVPPRSRLEGVMEVVGIAKEHKLNEQIRVRQVRLIDGEGNQVGIIDTREAMNMAKEKNLDLVMVGATAVPPVCRLMDYGRFRYEQQQNEKETRRRARHQEVKSIKFRVKIDAHDFETKTNHIKRFLDEGHKVKVTIMFRGRERTHPELGERILVRVAEEVKEIGLSEGAPSIAGMDMNMILAPHPGRAAKKADKADGAEPMIDIESGVAEASAIEAPIEELEAAEVPASS